MINEKLGRLVMLMEREKVENLKKAITENYDIVAGRVEVFISPDKTRAIIMRHPLAGMFEYQPGLEGIEIRYIAEKTWEDLISHSEFLEGVFSLHYILFPTIPLDIQFAEMRNWGFITEKFL